MRVIEGIKREYKQILAGFLAAVVLCTSVPFTAFSQEPVLYGDVDGNGIVEEADATLLKKAFAEYNVSINSANSDVNCDGSIDLHDLLLLEQFLAGVDVQLGEVVTVTFDTKGGSEVEAVILCKGATFAAVCDQVPSTEKVDALFAGWKTSSGEAFYAEDAVMEDMTLVASFEELPEEETLSLTTFTLQDQKPGLSFTIITEKAFSAEEVKNGLTLNVIDGSDPVELVITEVSSREFTVKAKDGFNEGCSYQITLEEGLHFKDKEATMYVANFAIHKEEVDNLAYNEDIIYIKDTEEMTYKLAEEEETVDVLEAAILSTSESKEVAAGWFQYEEAEELSVGDILCIYESQHPLERDYVNGDYSEDAMAYVEVTSISGKTIAFEAISEENAEKVFFLPDTIPFSVETIPTGETGTIDVLDYDQDGWKEMGYTGTPEYNKGDFLVFYNGAFGALQEDSTVYYAEVTEVSGSTINYKKTTIEEIEKAQDMFLQTPMSGDELLEGVDKEELEAQVERQALESGFAQEAAYFLAEAAKKTDGFQDMQLANLTAVVNGEEVPLEKVGNFGGSWEISDDVKVTATLGESSKYFDDGISLALRVEAEFSVDIGDGEMKIELSATFLEEISVDVETKANAKIKWYVIVPVFKSLYFGANVDLKNYSAVSLDVKVYTVEKEDESIWKKLAGIKGNPKLKEAFEQIEQLEEKIKEGKEAAEQIKKYKEDLENVWDSVEGLSKGEWTKDSYKEALEAVGELNVTEQLMDLLHMTSDEEMDAGVKDLMERYSEMLETESDWITLLEQQIAYSDQFIAPCFAIGYKIDFMIRANINIALGANMEYSIGKRYSFWFDIIQKTSGSDTMDIMDERFAFQFYVMGALGLKMGVRAEFRVGLGSVTLGSIGLSAEFGPYLKLWGYFIYEYSKMRPMGTNAWNYDERMMGALYLEFGLYIMIAFNAQILNGTLAYNPTLGDFEIPLLTAGNRINYYDFAYDLEEDEILLVEDSDGDSNNGYSMELPESYRTMKYLDLVEGDLEEEAQSLSNFIVTLSNRNFHLDKGTGVITVDVPKGVQYMECDLTLTWRLGKLEFSSKDISVTIPLVWTSLATSELNQRFTASVKVGNPEDGYTQVWSERVKKNTQFDLPTEEEIKELIGYVDGGINYKYEAALGYGSQQTEDLTIYTDTIYYYNVTPRTYTLTVNGVQDQAGNEAQKEFTAKYGEAFDLSELLASGANNAESEKFTSYYRTEALPGASGTLGQAINEDIARIIDNVFARDLLNGVNYTAKYNDNSVKVTYTFVGTGADVEDKVVTIARGDIAPDVFSSELAEKDLIITDISPAMGNISVDTEIVVTFKKYEAPKHTVTYQTNGGSAIESAEISEGALLIAPSQPTRTGYTFAGWYTDEAFENAFEFGTAEMPTNDITFYAKWTAEEYEVTFDANEGSLQEGTQNTLTVTYDSAYGTLPTPRRVGFKFLGWFTERVGGTQVNGTDMVKLQADQELFAHWEEKQEISADIITYSSGQGRVYDGTKLFFEFTSGNIPTDSFKVLYKRQSIDKEYAEFAQNAGTYDIKLVYEEDDTYKYFETVLVGVLKIEKAQGVINRIPSGTAFYSNILGEELVQWTDYIGDGTLSYGVSNSSTSTGSVKWYPDNLLTNIFDYAAISKDSSQVYLWVRLEEGENYKGTDIMVNQTPIAVTKPKSVYYNSDLYYALTVKTSDKKNAGTDARIYAYIGGDSWQRLSGSGNDFERGDEDTYVLPMKAAELYQNANGDFDVTIELEKNGTASWGWHCGWIRLDVVDSDGKVVFKGKQCDVNKWFDKDNPLYATYTVTTEDEKGYVFHIENDPLASLEENREVNAGSETYAWIWDGLLEVKNVYQDNTKRELNYTYNAFERTHAPELDVAFDNSDYNQFITRSIDGFVVEEKELYAKMAENGDQTLQLHVSLAFDSVDGKYVVDEESRSFSKTITYTAAGVEAPMLMSLESYPAARASRMMRSMGRSAMLRSVQPIATGENDTYTVSYNLAENPGIWGLKFAVNYNKDKVEMLEYALGTVFTAAEVVAPEQYNDGRYVFFASRAVTEAGTSDTTNTGTIVTLKFKTKDGSDFKEEMVWLDTSATQAINAESSVVAAGIGNLYQKVDTVKPVVVIDSGDYSEGTWTKNDVTLTPSNTANNMGTTTFSYRAGESGAWQTVAGGVVITKDCNETYYFKAVSESDVESDIKTFRVKVDKTAPSDIKISYNASEFKQFIHSITFGLFFNANVDVTAQAVDGGSGIAKYQYFAADTKLNDFADVEWKDSLSVTKNSKKYIYVKVIDIAGNEAIDGGEGIVVYTDSVKDTESITYVKTSIVGVKASITLNGNTIKEIKNGDTVIEASSYVVGEDGTITFKASYLDSLKADDYVLTISYNPLGEAYVEAVGNAAPMTTTIALKVEKAMPEVTFPVGLSIESGRKLSDISIEDSHFTWDVSDTVVSYGPHMYQMTYTPEDTDSYHIVQKDVEVIGLDITAPKGEIQIGTNRWNSFFNSITFGLFSKETQTVNVAATDMESGVKATEYYLASTVVESFTDVTWTAFQDTFNISPNNTYVIYVKITDHAGNGVIINSDGIVLDDIKPVISGIIDGGTYTGSVCVQVTEENISKVMLDDKEVVLDAEGRFNVSSAEGIQTIIAIDKAGNESAVYKITVNEKNNGENPPTGDQNNLLLWMAVISISCGIVITVSQKKKRMK